MLEFILGEIYIILSKMSSLTKSDKNMIYDKVNYAINQTRTHIRNTRQGNIDQSSSTLSNIWQRTGKALKGIHHPEIQELAKTIEQ
ncbi:MAG: hypothetical protein K8S18_09560, partial [Desulfobacula sp.]|nr:hypothetical protein [Desulfobacula sp.]